MPSKIYKNTENFTLSIAEPAVAYQTATSELSSSDKWNPNVPFHGTQEEWWDHFHRIEEGEFMTIEEADEKFEKWKTKLLASLM
jgi:hypothetical protein